MIGLDPTLRNIRKINSGYMILIAEANNAGFQSMDDFYKEVKAFYAQQGITVSDKLIKFIVDVFGAEAANNPQVAQIAKNIFKNPKRFISNVEKALGVNSSGLAQKVNAVGNVQNDPNVAAVLPKILDSLLNIEKNVSMTRSVGETQSTDLYSVVQKLDQMSEMYPDMAETFKYAAQYYKTQLDAESGKPVASKFDNTNLTNYDVKFSQGDLGKIYEGKVLVDSDDGNLSQEYLDSLNQGKSQPLVKETLPEIQAMKHHVWVQSQGQVYIVPKTAIHNSEQADSMADFIPQSTEEVRSLFQMAKVFFQPITGNYKKDNRIRKALGHAKGRMDFQNAQMSSLTSKWGMHDLPSADEENKGEWYSPLGAGSMNLPIVMVLNWLSENVSDSGVSIDSGNLMVKDVKMTTTDVSNKYFVARFMSNTRSYDVSKVVSMDVRNINVEELLNFCRQKGISAINQGKQVLIKNKFGQ